ncbi:hypothetical protein KIN20_009753 [Parelaphostrongylus tenuis]|uniref:Uncharacterized protein n=1 Tax=Parelaphostrongylus tenuis TaxID=148309 RepID=A0AAD5MSZ5_PARTN|nr:hypothetical protein KIN20_009753 [Parelaphostrongylus tenuis]
MNIKDNDEVEIEVEYSVCKTKNEKYLETVPLEFHEISFSVAHVAQWLEVLRVAHEVNGSISRSWLTKPSIPPGSANWYQTGLRLVWEDKQH